MSGDYVGGPQVGGWVALAQLTEANGTRKVLRRDLTVEAAQAISGAAIASQMGTQHRVFCQPGLERYLLSRLPASVLTAPPLAPAPTWAGSHTIRPPGSELLTANLTSQIRQWGGRQSQAMASLVLRLCLRAGQAPAGVVHVGRVPPM